MIKKVYNQEQVLKIISENPGISSTQIAEKMQLSRVTIFLYLKELQNLQKIRIEGKGKATRYFLHISLAIVKNLDNPHERKLTESDIQILQQEIQFALIEAY